MAADGRNDETAATLVVEVVYLRDPLQFHSRLTVRTGATVRDAIDASGVLAQAPELDAQALDVGIFNRPVSVDTPVRNGDRVEIYRPLTVDPKEARRVRVEVRRRRKGTGSGRSANGGPGDDRPGS